MWFLLSCVGEKGVDSSGESEPVVISEACAALGTATSGQVVGPQDDLAGIVATTSPGSTLLLSAGTYELDRPLEVMAEGVTLRSQSGDPTSVTLDGMYAASSLVVVGASNVTVAGLTLTRSYGPAVLVLPEQNISGTQLYQLVVRDAGEEAVRIAASMDGLAFADAGVLGCSTLLRTVTGAQDASVTCAGGLDAVSVADWRVYGNVFSGFYCGEDSVAAVAFRDGSRNTVMERNRIFDSDVLVALGDDDGPPATPRTDDTSACPEGGSEVEHYGGVIQNNFLGLAGDDPDNLARTGIFLGRACNVSILHNTLWSERGPDQSVRVFGSQTTASLTNNLVSVPFIEIAGLAQTDNGNASSTDFVDAQSGDFHLSENSSAIESGSPTALAQDIDLDPRGALPDQGADER